MSEFDDSLDYIKNLFKADQGYIETHDYQIGKGEGGRWGRKRGGRKRRKEKKKREKEKNCSIVSSLLMA